MQYHVRRNICKWLICISSFLTMSHLYAFTKVNDYFMEVWTSHQGLPHNSVNAITQTDDGYLWFATWEGVARYNGLSFTLFSRDEQKGIVDAGVRTLTASENNRLWVGGARGGVTVRQSFSWFPQTLAQGLVNHVFVDHQRNLWIAVEGEGVFFRPFLSDNEYGPEKKVLNIATYRLAQFEKGSVFAATKQGVYKLSGNSSEHISLPGLPSDTRANYISFDHAGNLLIASVLGAWRYDGVEVKRYRNELSNEVITLIEEDDEGRIWFGTIDKGIARLSLKQLDFINTDNGLPNNRVLSWFQDAEGSIWVGTNGGVLRLRSAPFMSVNKFDGLLGEFTRTVLPISGGRFLVGTSEGLSIVDGGVAKPSSASFLSQQSVLSLAPSTSGKIYVGTQRSGLYEWQNGGLTPRLSVESGLPSNEVRAILEDSVGRLWVGTVNGVVLVTRDGKTKLINQANSNLPDDYVIAISEDQRGRIWFGTAEGVALYDRLNNIEVVDISVYEGAQYVFGFYIEPGFVWMATDRGLLRYDVLKKRIDGVGKPAGLPIDKIFQVVYDHLGSFWLTSNRGIWKVGYVEAHRVASGNLQTIDFEHFGEADGMGSDQVNGGSTPAAASTKGGYMAFATAKGLSIIKPTSLKQLYQYRLPVVLEQIDADGKLVNPDETPELGPGINRLRIKFAGLSYIMSQRIQYQTKLTGFEEEWNYQGNQTIAEYTNLPPGKYEFRVSARYPYGAWNDSNVTYHFEILPFWWQRLEVQVIVLLLIIVLISSMIIWRVNALKRRQIYLAEQIDLKTQELREQSELYEHQSREDPLTALSNRRAFDEKVRGDFILAYPSLSKLNLAIIDIDHFKQVNDRFSHLVGDEVIKLVADYLNESIGEPNQVARWGGEEFTVLIHGTQEEAREICQTLLNGIAQLECPQLENKFNLTVSIGYANALGCQDYQTLLKRADQALYAAKEKGRNRVEEFDEFRMYG